MGGCCSNSETSSLYFMTNSLVRLVLKFLQYLPASCKTFFFALGSTSNVAYDKKTKIKIDTNQVDNWLKITKNTLTWTVFQITFFLSLGTCPQLSILIGIVIHARLPTMLARWFPSSPNACPHWLYLMASLIPSLHFLTSFFMWVMPRVC